MSVTLKLSGQCRLSTGCDTKCINIDQSIALHEFLKEHAPTSCINPQGELESSILVFVNSKQSSCQETIMIHDGDEVTLMSPMSGG